VPSADTALFVLSAAIVLLAALAVVFAVVTILLRAANSRRARLWSVLEARWEARVMDVLAGDAAPEQVHRLVGPREQLYFADFLLRFQRRLRGAEREVIAALAAPYLDAVAAQLRLRDPERRARAVQTLSRLGGGRHGDAVVRALDDDSALVAMVAARALVRSADPGRSAEVLKRMHRFRGWSPRYLASLLAGMGPDAAPTLCDFAADAANPAAVRAVAVDALRMLHDLPSADVAAALLGATEDRELLAACLRLLAALGRTEHLHRARARLRDGDAVVRAMATRAVGALGGSADLADLRRALDDPSPWVAIEGANGLGSAGGEDVLRDVAGSTHPRAVLAQQVLRSAA